MEGGLDLVCCPLDLPFFLMSGWWQESIGDGFGHALLPWSPSMEMGSALDLGCLRAASARSESPTAYSARWVAIEDEDGSDGDAWPRSPVAVEDDCPLTLPLVFRWRCYRSRSASTGMDSARRRRSSDWA
ncbi:hypothetical protein ACLOJK_037635 [Asimina triloba]